MKIPGVAVLGLAVSGDGKRFATADFDYSATLWETDTGKDLVTCRRQTSALTPDPGAAQVALAADGKSVIACWVGFSSGSTRDSTFVCRFDGATGKESWSKTAPLQGAVPLRWTGKTLLLGGGANPFCEWQSADGTETRTWGGHKGPVTALAASSTGAILSAGNEGVLFLSSGHDGNQSPPGAPTTRPSAPWPFARTASC